MELEDHDEAHGHDEPWLVSFADLMTLLFGFFVIMYSFATAGDEEFEKIRKELAQHFGGEYMTPYEKLKEDLTEKISASEFEGSVEMRITDEGLQITFRSTVLFSSGSATLYLGAEKLMNELVKIKANHLRRVVEEVFCQQLGRFRFANSRRPCEQHRRERLFTVAQLSLRNAYDLRQRVNRIGLSDETRGKVFSDFGYFELLPSIHKLML